MAGTSVGAILYACRTFEPSTVLVVMASDILIGLAYLNIGMVFMSFIFWALWKKWSFDRIRITLAAILSPALFIMIGLFIFSCGTTHLAHVLVTLYGPNDFVEMVSRLPTMIVSVITAFLINRAFWLSVRK